MGFLDNLENSLKSLERQEENDPAAQQRRIDEAAQKQAIAPWAEKLKTSDFTNRLFDEAAAAGHRVRTKIYMAWLDSTLRLEARQRRLELQPTPSGIEAVFIEPDGSSRKRPLDLSSKPEELLQEWIG